ncbi:MAG: GPR endopeptidase [Hydrogenibacillus sp.]|nr:GPR endopeptidase [Hydrogenibacillus sp.]
MSLDLSRHSPRTDLALEAHEAIVRSVSTPRDADAPEETLDGVRREEHVEGDGAYRVVRLWIETEEASRKLGKPLGHYVTFEFPGLIAGDGDYRTQAGELFSAEMAKFLRESGVEDDATVLVVGLGNRMVTPDALGPIVAQRVRVTRHLFQYAPESLEPGYRSVAALAPGVLGTTGVETGDIVESVVQKIACDAVVVVDALAARSLSRLYKTIQVTDTGIHPGSGIGNKRQPLNRETLGVPVIALGVPTVVDASTIAGDAIDLLMKHLGRQMKESARPNARSRLVPDTAPLYDRPPKLTDDDLPPSSAREALFGMLGTLSPEEKYGLIREVLEPLGVNLIVTPKEVDGFIDDIGQLIAAGLNRALHAKVDRENVAHYTH